MVGCGGDGGDRYKVAVTFDTAKGVVPGQLVKVAGVRAGKIADVDLAPGNKARMELEVDSKFAPFRADASCRILPEGLISENYVECDTGSPAKPELGADKAGTPVVPVEQTTAPVSLQDVLNTFDMPTDQRLRMLLNELGIGTAGRGGDINAILRRANPSLTQARQVLRTLSDQRREIADAVGQTDAVLARLGDDSESVRSFVARAVGHGAGHRGPQPRPGGGRPAPAGDARRRARRAALARHGHCPGRAAARRPQGVRPGARAGHRRHCPTSRARDARRCARSPPPRRSGAARSSRCCRWRAASRAWRRRPSRSRRTPAPPP